MQLHSLLSALGQPRSGEQFVTTTISTDEDDQRVHRRAGQTAAADWPADEATTQVIRHRQGFTANIYASPAGTRVVNYLKWPTRDDLETMLADPI